MDEYIERGTLRKKLLEGSEYLDEDTLMVVINVLDSEPAADVAIAIRCGHCKHSRPPAKLTQIYGEPGTLTCHNRNSPCNNRNVNERDFCSYGEREEGADDED